MTIFIVYDTLLIDRLVSQTKGDDILSQFSEQAKESRDKILKAAEELFSSKGFDGTSVREISEKSEVKKALIFYYFKSKEEILQNILDKFIYEMKEEAIKVLSQEKYNMQKEGKLAFNQNKFKFSELDDDHTVDQYLDAAINQSLDFYLERKNIIRIMFDESLKKGNHSSMLFRITDLLYDKDMESIQNSLEQNGFQVQIDNTALVERFFTGLMPMLSFVIYFDEWKEHYHISEEEFKASFIKSYKTTFGNQYRS